MTHHSVHSNNKPKGKHTSKKVTRRRKGSLGELLTEALQAEGKTLKDLAVTPVKPTRQRKNITKKVGVEKEDLQEQQGVQWEHDLANITVSVDEGTCGDIVANGPYTSAELTFFDKRPESLNVRMVCDVLDDDLLVFSVQSGDNIRRVEQANLPHLVIPINWVQGGPQIRKAHEDNAGIIVMDKKGRFVHLETGVTIRSKRNPETKRFEWIAHLNLQEVFTGQVVRTTIARAKEFGLNYVEHNGKAATVIPLWGYHNYPGNNWLGMNPAKIFGMETVVPTALAEDRSVPLFEASFEEWDPPKFGAPSEPDSMRGIVLWYNCAWGGGAGRILTSDGRDLYVNWRQLREMYAPQPMSLVEFKIGEHNGNKQAQDVRAVQAA